MTWQAEWIDYYELLEVSSTARTAVIEAAYKKLSLEYHPDRGGDTAKMQVLNDARETLLDEAKRRRYDLEHARRTGDGQDQEATQRRAEQAERRAEQAEREAKAAEERARRAENDANRHQQGSAYEDDPFRSAGRAGPTEQERDQALDRLRRVANEEWRRAAGVRAERQLEIDGQRLAAEREATASAAQQTTGLFSKLKRGVTCGVGAHKGDWFYVDADRCDQSRTCRRCGNDGQRITHEWTPAQRIVDAACEFVAFCTRCGDEHVSLVHEWQATYLSTDCRQVDVCEHCAEVDHDSVRVRHTWGAWQATSSTTQSRACTRCGERETNVEPDRRVREPGPEPISQPFGDRGSVRSGRTKGFTGRWQSADGSLHDLYQSGSRVQIQGASIHGVLMQGAGVVQGRRAIIDCVNNLGVGGRLVVDLTGDGSAISGMWHGTNGTSAVMMSRVS